VIADAVVRGVIVTLAILVPPVVIVRILLGPDADSPLLYLVLLAFLVSFFVGGRTAASRAPELPLKHAAVTGAVAFGVAFAVAVVRNLATGRSMTLGGVLFAIVVWGTATTISTIGAALGGRRPHDIEGLRS
jgi:hypothetical protein